MEMPDVGLSQSASSGLNSYVSPPGVDKFKEGT